MSDQSLKTHSEGWKEWRESKHGCLLGGKGKWNSEYLEYSVWNIPKGNNGVFPGGPVAKTPYSHCKGPGFNSWSGN